MAGRIAAVTGATGFLGRRLVPALVERGWQVRALTRSRPPAGLWGEAAVDIVRGDLADADALASLTDGAQAVIHAAGLIKARTRAEFFAANAEGAQRVAQAAGEARMLLISSLAAREPALSDYAASKRAGEEAARMIAGGRLTVVRPPAIYGPGDRETLGLFRLAAQSPVLALPGPATARLALAHVDDVVATILALMEHPAPPASATVPGARPEGYGWREIFQAAAAAVGARPALAAAPRWLVGAAGGVSELAGAFTRDAPIFTRGKAREILHPDWSVSPAEQAPDAPPARFDLASGFADTVAWYRAHGWLA
jgi:nucleoside-diphosphate-sugar epimerase